MSTKKSENLENFWIYKELGVLWIIFAIENSLWVILSLVSLNEKDLNIERLS